MSTRAEILRIPLRSKRCFIQSGVAARAFTFSITRLIKRPQSAGASICTGCLRLPVIGAAWIAGCLNAQPVSADTSRAIPLMLRQSARFGVIFSVNTVSSKSRYSRMFAPTGASCGRMCKPFTPSSGRPSSSVEHNIPFDTTPRILVGLILKLPGNTAPGNEHGTLMPAFTFGAPHTICINSPVPASTWVTFKRSASGCFSTDFTSAITTPVNAGAAVSASSTSRPDMVSKCESCSGVRLASVWVFSQEWENCMV